MLKLCRFTKVKAFFLVLVYVFNFDLFELSAAILEKGLFSHPDWLPRRGIQREITTLESEALRDIATFSKT